MERDVFKALGEPIRRRIIEILVLSPKGETITDLSKKIEYSRQACTKHLTTLVESGLIKIEKSGRSQVCKADLKDISSALEWMNKHYSMWSYKLDALENYLDNEMDK